MMNIENKSEYDYLMDRIDNFIEKYNLDRVSVKSLLLSSVEFDYPEAEAANIAVITERDLTSGKSIKAGNVKISLKLALNTIFALKTAFSESGCWLILCILQVITSLKEEMEVEFDKNEAVVLFSVYRLRSASFEDIEKYVQRLKDSKQIADKDDINIADALNKLEKMRTIQLIEGKYSLREAILIK